MKNTHKIGIFSLAIASIALSIGVISAKTSSLKAEATVGEKDTIGTTALTEVSDDEIVVIGTSNTNCGTAISSDWISLGTTQTSFIDFQVEIADSGFYLKRVSNSAYLYSSAAKKITTSTSKKTLYTLDESGVITGTTDSTNVGSFQKGTSGLRPYTSTTGDYAHLYKVTSVSVSSIAVTTAPTKTEYKEGETFDSTGMVVTATYSDASTADVTSECTFSPTTALTSSDTEITITYNSVTTTQAISIITLTSLTKEGTLVKTAYNEGQNFDATGLTIYANYSNGDKEDVTSSVTWGSLKQGDTSVTGTYGSQTITVEGITVDAPLAFTKLTSASDLAAGDKILFVYETGNKAAGAIYSTTGYNSYLTSKDVTITDGYIADTTNLAVFTVGGDASAWTFTYDDGTIAANSTSNSALNVFGAATGWTVSLDSSNNATIKNTTYTTYLKYNSGSPRFSTYSSGQTDIQIYRKGDTTSEKVITGVSVESSSERATLNNTFAVTATVEGGAQADKTVTWTASPADAVSLASSTSTSGSSVTVTAKKAGEVTLKATANGDTSKYASVTVTIVDPSAIESVTLNKTQAGILHTDSSYSNLVATVSPDEATNKNVTWSSSDSTIASVNSSTGVVTSYEKSGVATITATSVADTSKSASCEMFVFSQKGYTEVAPLCPEDVKIAIDHDTWPYDLDEDSEQAEIFSYYVEGYCSEIVSSKSSEITINIIDDLTGNTVQLTSMTSGAGDISTIALGSVVKAYFGYDSASLTGGIYKISKPECVSVEAGSVDLISLSLTGTNTVKAGNSVTLSLTYNPTYTTQTGVSWTSSNTSVATVDSNGVVTGVAAGSTTITVTSTVKSSIKATLDMTVTSASEIAGTYTLSSNTTTYTAINSGNFTTLISGYDSSAFSYNVPTGLYVGASPSTSSISFSADSSLQLGAAEGYVIAKVTLMGSHVNGSTDAPTLSCGGMSYTPTSTKGNYEYLPFASTVTISSATYRTFIDSVVIEVVAEGDTSMATTYAQTFLNITAPECVAMNGIADNTWTNLWAGYDNLETLDSSISALVKGATASESGSVLEQCAARYDYIVAKYSSLTNFMERAVSANHINPINVNGNTAIVIVIATSLIGLTTAGLFFISYKKRKEN